jgi:hypothetical protein
MLSLLQQALVKEGRHAFQRLSRSIMKIGTDCFYCLQGATPDKDREAPEEALLLGI